jgi:hypothetical protein
MKSYLWIASLALVAFVILVGSARADDERGTLVRFKGGIGVIPVSSGAGTATTATTVNRNIVRTIQPPGQLWTIRDLDTKIKKNGDIKVEGKGLVLAGGNGIGSPPANPTRVFATLICEAAAPFIEHSTTLTGVALAPNGDFKIDDVLTPIPNGCASPVLLIRSANGGAWFAAGIPIPGDSD